MTLRAGLARTLITPPRGSYLIGYGDRWRGARGVRDELTATALLLDDGERRIGVLTLDLLCLHEDVVAALRERARALVGLAPEALLVACSHTHAGPIAYAGPRALPWRRRLVERLVEKGAGALAQAAETLAPVVLSAGEGRADVACNRRERRPDGSLVIGRNPEGFVDKRLRVVALGERESPTPRALLVNFACHPAVMGPRNRMISAEWPGVMRRALEQRSGATCLFLQGATGDLNPEHEWGEDDEIAMERLGDTLARAAGDVLDAGLRPLEGTPLAAERAEVALGVVPRRGADGALEGYRTTAARRLRVPEALVDPLLAYAYPWRPRQQAGPEGAATLPMEIQVLRCGELAIVAHAAETFSELGAAVLEASAAPFTLFAGYANGMVGYLPTAAAAREGGYEVEEAPLAYRLSGRFEPGAGEAVVARSAALLRAAFAR